MVSSLKIFVLFISLTSLFGYFLKNPCLVNFFNILVWFFNILAWLISLTSLFVFLTPLLGSFTLPFFIREIKILVFFVFLRWKTRFQNKFGIKRCSLCITLYKKSNKVKKELNDLFDKKLLISSRCCLQFSSHLLFLSNQHPTQTPGQFKLSDEL